MQLDFAGFALKPHAGTSLVMKAFSDVDLMVAASAHRVVDGALNSRVVSTRPHCQCIAV